jgi:electron transport complex protein RnfG
LVLGSDRAERLKNEKIALEIMPGIIQTAKAGKAIHYPIFRVDVDEQLAGWVIKASGQGYSGNIELLLGLDPLAETITGLFVLEQKETPGLGNKIISTDWRDQFIDKKTSQPLMLTKSRRQEQTSGGYDIDAITGATISSRAATGIVNGIISNTKGKLTPDFIQYFERNM